MKITTTLVTGTIAMPFLYRVANLAQATPVDVVSIGQNISLGVVVVGLAWYIIHLGKQHRSERADLVSRLDKKDEANHEKDRTHLAAIQSLAEQHKEASAKGHETGKQLAITHQEAVSGLQLEIRSLADKLDKSG